MLKNSSLNKQWIKRNSNISKIFHLPFDIFYYFLKRKYWSWYWYLCFFVVFMFWRQLTNPPNRPAVNNLAPGTTKLWIGTDFMCFCVVIFQARKKSDTKSLWWNETLILIFALNCSYISICCTILRKVKYYHERRTDIHLCDW